MDTTGPSRTVDSTYETIGDALDRLEIFSGKIGMIPAQQGFELLRGLDSVYTRMQELDEDNPSLKIYQAQFDGIVAKLRKEGSRFLRDLGGVQALEQARAEMKPPQDHWWWYLDEWLASRRRSAIQRSLVIAGAVVVILAILVMVYNRFLAPSPQDTARYASDQSARDLLIKGDLQGALDQVNKGLAIPPADPALLVLKGVILDTLGQTDQAQQLFTQAKGSFPAPEDFYQERGQDYVQANQPDKALADAQAAIQANPNSAQAYLLLGQVYEMQRQFQTAMDTYNKAYDVASQTGHTELAALARMRLAMLMQSLNSQMPTELQVTPTP